MSCLISYFSCKSIGGSGLSSVWAMSIGTAALKYKEEKINKMKVTLFVSKLVHLKFTANNYSIATCPSIEALDLHHLRCVCHLLYGSHMVGLGENILAKLISQALTISYLHISPPLKPEPDLMASLLWTIRKEKEYYFPTLALCILHNANINTTTKQCANISTENKQLWSVWFTVYYIFLCCLLNRVLKI